MRNLLIIAQKVDQDDDLLGFFIDWIIEFSKNFEKVFVITLLAGNYNLPTNVEVYSLGKENHASKLRQLARFYKLLFQLVPRSNGIFAHMSPIFAVAAWPVSFIFGKKIILWYLHRSITLKLKLAEKLCFKIVTAAKESLNIKSKKIVEVGHGINIGLFKTERNWDNFGSGGLNMLSVGRISRIKNYETLIQAARILEEKSINFKLEIVGRPIMPSDFKYLEDIKGLISELGLENKIELVGFVPYNQIRDYYKKCDIFVNLTPIGGIDKVVLEAMASGALVLVSNEAFRKYIGSYDLIFKYQDPTNLADRIVSLINTSSREVKSISDFLTKSVSEHHDLNRTIEKICKLYL